MCVKAASSGGGTRQEWAGRPDRRPVVSTNVHHGTVRHQQVGSAGSRHAGDAGSDAGGSGGSELVSQQQPDQQLMNDASEAHFTALNVGVVMF